MRSPFVSLAIVRPDSRDSGTDRGAFGRVRIGSVRGIVLGALLAALSCAGLTLSGVGSEPAGAVFIADSSALPTTTDESTTTTSTAPDAGSDGSAVSRPKVAIAVVRVVLSEQKAYVFDASRRLVATLPISSGLHGTTPIGSFKVFSRSAKTFYAPDPAEKMDWMVRFTKSDRGNNIGFHSIPYRITKKGRVLVPTPIGQEPSSKGCIRLRNADARWLFHNVRIGTRIIVQRTRL